MLPILVLPVEPANEWAATGLSDPRRQRRRPQRGRGRRGGRAHAVREVARAPTLPSLVPPAPVPALVPPSRAWDDPAAARRRWPRDEAANAASVPTGQSKKERATDDRPKGGAEEPGLLARCENLLKALQRHRRHERSSHGACGRAAELAAMYWRGCRHPGALHVPPLHPATGVVRWLSGFTAREQHVEAQIILRALAAEERWVLALATELAVSYAGQPGGLAVYGAMLQALRLAADGVAGTSAEGEVA